MKDRALLSTSRLHAKDESRDFCTRNTVRCNSQFDNCLHNTRDKKHALVDSSRLFHFVDFGSGGRVLDWWMGVGSVRDLGSVSCRQTRCAKKRNTKNLEFFPSLWHSAEKESPQQS